jgi:hypothetical protein
LYLQYEGNVWIYDIFGKVIKNFMLPENSTSSIHILECQFWGNGIVAMNADMQIFVAEVCIHSFWNITYNNTLIEGLIKLISDV